MAQTVSEWLAQSDPSITWQVERDVERAPSAVWLATRAKVATEGWGAGLLEHQDPDGTWGQGLYSPKWTSTTYTLLLLRRFGLPMDHPAPRRGCMRLLDDATWRDGGVSYWKTHTYAEGCVNAMVLSVCSYFGIEDPRVDSIADLLVRTRMRDGGWNCEDHRGATHSSFHTTISCLEGLHLWRSFRATTEADDVIASGQEFMLDHRMYKSHRTGETIDEEWTTFHFPPRWHYDILRGLDHLRDAGCAPDERAEDAMEVVARRRRPGGTWPKGSQYGGVTFFPLEPGRVPGRWNTMRALRVQAWWEGA